MRQTSGIQWDDLPPDDLVTPRGKMITVYVHWNKETILWRRCFSEHEIRDSQAWPRLVEWAERCGKEEVTHELMRRLFEEQHE